MLSDARQKLIEKIALRDGEVIISRVAKELNVSIETIRRDINVMCEQNLLVKVHGGAVPSRNSLLEPSYRQRKKIGSATKNRIGKAAAELIKGKQVVALSTGSTIEAVAANIKTQNNINILTNSLPIANILSDMADSGDFCGKITLFGGQLHPTEHLTFGGETINQIQTYSSDISFIGAAAIATNGLMSTNTDEGSVAKEMLSCSTTVVLVAESKKFDKRSIFRFATLESVNIIITDSENPIPEDLLSKIKDYEIKLIIV